MTSIYSSFRAGFICLLAVIVSLALAGSSYSRHHENHKPMQVKILNPKGGARVGLGTGKAWFIDLEVAFDGVNIGSILPENPPSNPPNPFNPAFQMTGPLGHENIPPFPREWQFLLGDDGQLLFEGSKDDGFPGLVVAISGLAAIGPPFSSIPGLEFFNFADGFNLTGLATIERFDKGIIKTVFLEPGILELLVGSFGGLTVDPPELTVLAAVVADLNGDGFLNDAPDMITDSNGNGLVDEKDLEALGLASNVAKARFFINRSDDLVP